MKKPIFPFSVNMPSKPWRKNIRLMRVGAVWVIRLVIINAILAFIFLTTTQFKSLQPVFISFSPVKNSFIALSPESVSEKNKLKKDSQNLLKEDFIRNYVIWRETLSNSAAETHRRLCDCYTSEREKTLIEKTRNRTVQPRCAVCLMSDQPTYQKFRSETLTARLEKQARGKRESVSIKSIEFLSSIPSKHGGKNYNIYKAFFEQTNKFGKTTQKIATLGIEERSNETDEFLFRVISYGLMVNTQ